MAINNSAFRVDITFSLHTRSITKPSKTSCTAEVFENSDKIKKNGAPQPVNRLGSQLFLFACDSARTDLCNELYVGIILISMEFTEVGTFGHRVTSQTIAGAEILPFL